MTTTLKLELFISPSCPFCQKVVHFLEKNNLTVPIVTIDDNWDAIGKLKERSGKTQVPCLFMNDSYMHESDEIIKYLQEKLL